jgi:hypothetical protein
MTGGKAHAAYPILAGHCPALLKPDPRDGIAAALESRRAVTAARPRNRDREGSVLIGRDLERGLRHAGIMRRGWSRNWPKGTSFFKLIVARSVGSKELMTLNDNATVNPVI